MDYIEVQSSSLKAVAYNEQTSTLCVRFLSGSEYHYEGVPRVIFQGLLQAESVGKYFGEFVKSSGYRYKQVR